LRQKTSHINGFGYIISTGNIKGFNTTGSGSGETWADGDVLYYNPSGNGLMTNVKPSAPNMKTEVAIVINAGSGGSGSVAVEIIHGTQLGGTDSNVQITSVTGGQVTEAMTKPIVIGKHQFSGRHRHIG